jgi:hypothetical protein
MHHPASPVKRSLTGQIPWNSARENQLARFQAESIIGWLVALAVCLLFARPWQLALMVMGGCTLALLWVIVWTGAQQDKMAANKPAASNVSEMTVWEEYLPDANLAFCSCGRVLSFANAEPFPKSDRDGDQNVRIEGGYPVEQARWAMVCECGKGYYKLMSNRLNVKQRAR